MAKRPWVTPKEVKQYSEYKQVRERTPARLKMDIARAEAYVISYTNNDFADVDQIPEPVKLAVILLAENYAYNATADTVTGGKRMKSETYDDYSYNAGDEYFAAADDLDIKGLLDPFTRVKPRGGVTLRMRKL